MTYKEAWCKILNEINSTYNDEIKEALFMLAVAAKRQDDETKALSHLVENPYFVGFGKKDDTIESTEIKNKPISILDRDEWNVNAIKTNFEEQDSK